MKQTSITLPSITLIGISERTAFQFEMNPMTSKIGPCCQRYFGENLIGKVQGRTKPGTTYCVYTDYESNHTGAYTFFIGEEVDENTEVPEGLSKFVIPAQTYTKFTTVPGPMPMAVIEAWQKIWQMTPEQLGGNRRFDTDFQIHDERSLNPMSTVLDLFVGVE
jgi:predicted transcriptional regulator YdeE